ncbi:MAG: phospho-sugar mutase [Clostridia bacterium]|nr:phospho-sugar mutase [Clostridia bacterium]
MEFQEKYNYWRTSETFDDETHQELEKIKDDENEIKERFYKDLEFGTAGLRGVIGAGTNRMNKYTVTKATQGLANYIIKTGKQDKGVVIAFDSRRFSPEFSRWAALCLNANGIKTYRFDTLRPTPVLSFAVRELGCVAGIVVTASHNPPEYNGYKVYWEDGAQIVPPIDGEIISEVNAITDYSTIKMMDLEEAINKGLYNVVGEELDRKYIDTLKSLVLNPEAIKNNAKDLKIVYTPLHGTGNIPVQTVLKELGFENVYVVPEQEKPDGEFPTVSYPNPEDPKAFALALDLAKKVDADIILANDPDADRLGVFVKKNTNGETPEYEMFTGNMSALFIAEYELSQKKEKGILPENGAIITTIVSSDLTKAMAKEYNMKLFEVLTGFKWIGEKIKQFEQAGGNYEYVFGFEESYGCLVGTHARDKDGIVAVMATCEAAAYYKSKGISAYEQMDNIYKKYGYYKEGQIALTFKGIEGAEKIKSIMDKLRSNPPTELAGLKVLEFRDYKENIVKDLQTGDTHETGLPNSNVLYFDLENSSWCCVRPSGTEPKIKFYCGVCTDSSEKSAKQLEALKEHWGNI